MIDSSSSSSSLEKSTSTSSLLSATEKSQRRRRSRSNSNGNDRRKNYNNTESTERGLFSPSCGETCRLTLWTCILTIMLTIRNAANLQQDILYELQKQSARQEYASITRAPNGTTLITTTASTTAIPTATTETTSASSNDDNNDCLLTRGTNNGEWVQDLGYTKDYNYIPADGYRAKKYRDWNKVLPQNTYRWHEEQCPISTMTLDGLCNALQILDIKHIVFVGDSLQGSMFHSFQYLLQLSKQTRQVTCPSLHTNNGDDDNVISLKYIRQNLAPQQKDDNNECSCSGDKVAKHKLNETFSICPYYQNYVAAAKQRTNQRVLMVVNGGAHYHSTKDFEYMMDGFVDTVQYYRQLQKLRFGTDSSEDDIVFFRTTPPGHANCYDQPGRPFQSYNDFLQHSYTTKYDWNLFDEYNQYAKEKISTMDNVHLLNVHNMTALRVDGHVSASDCLHYELPGPVDWWNHLLYSQILELANRKKQVKTEKV